MQDMCNIWFNNDALFFPILILSIIAWLTKESQITKEFTGFQKKNVGILIILPAWHILTMQPIYQPEVEKSVNAKVTKESQMSKDF